MVRVGLVGFGYWGPKLARCMTEAEGVTLAALCDRSAERLALAAERHPGVRLTEDWQRLIADPALDAIALATPAAVHAPMALAALRAGKHVLVEKPLARSSAEAEALVAEAARRGRVLMVDHTFLFSPQVARIAALIAAGELGQIRSIDSLRAGNGIARDDVNVLWDMAVHDLSILDHVLPMAPCAVAATGLSGAGARAHAADLTVLFAGNVAARVHVDWHAQGKTRRMRFAGSRRMLSYEHLHPEATLRLSDGADDPGPCIPVPDAAEPLRAAVEHFAGCIRSGHDPLSDGSSALRIIRVLEAADRSLAAGGAMIGLAPQAAVAG